MLIVKHSILNNDEILSGYYIMVEGAILIDTLKELSTRLKMPYHELRKIYIQCGGRPDEPKSSFYNFPTKEQAEMAFVTLKLMGKIKG